MDVLAADRQVAARPSSMSGRSLAWTLVGKTMHAAVD